MSKLKNFQKTQVRHWFDFPSEYKNKTIHFYGSDSEELFDKNDALDWDVTGGEQPTSHIKQTNKYKKDGIEYKFNSRGMRGPEYEYTCTHTKILHIGASFTFGFGVNENETYPHYLSRLTHGCYWNVSPANTIFQIVDILEDLLDKLKPSTLIISTPRFVQDFDYLHKTFREKIEDKELSHMFLDTKMESKKTIQNWWINYLNLLSKLHNFKVVFINHGYKYWKDFVFPKIESEDFKFLHLSEKEIYIDLSRDCRHPGPKSHKQVAEKIFKLL